MMGLGLFFPPFESNSTEHWAELGLGTANLPILALPGALSRSHGQ